MAATHLPSSEHWFSPRDEGHAYTLAVRPWALVAAELREACTAKQPARIDDLLAEAQQLPMWSRRLMAEDIAFARQRLARLREAAEKTSSIFSEVRFVDLSGGRGTHFAVRPAKASLSSSSLIGDGTSRAGGDLALATRVVRQLEEFLGDYGFDVPDDALQDLTRLLRGLRNEYAGRIQQGSSATRVSGHDASITATPNFSAVAVSPSTVIVPQNSSPEVGRLHDDAAVRSSAALFGDVSDVNLLVPPPRHATPPSSSRSEVRPTHDASSFTTTRRAADLAKVQSELGRTAAVELDQRSALDRDELHLRAVLAADAIFSVANAPRPPNPPQQQFDDVVRQPVWGLSHMVGQMVDARVASAVAFLTLEANERQARDSIVGEHREAAHDLEEMSRVLQRVHSALSWFMHCFQVAERDARFEIVELEATLRQDIQAELQVANTTIAAMLRRRWRAAQGREALEFSEAAVRRKLEELHLAELAKLRVNAWQEHVSSGNKSSSPTVHPNGVTTSPRHAWSTFAPDAPPPLYPLTPPRRASATGGADRTALESLLDDMDGME